jgi:hypothetical protein
MADTTFTPGTKIVSSWLNDVNDTVYGLPDSTDVANGDALYAVKQPYTGAVARTGHAKNTDIIYVSDFGAVGDGVVDDTSAIQAALTAAGNAFKQVSCIGGATYRITSALTVPNDVLLDMNWATFSKGFNGAIIGYMGKRAKIYNGIFNGNGATYSGAGIVIDQGGGSSSWDELGHQAVVRCRFENCRSYSIDYPTAGLGSFSQVHSCQFLPLPVSSGGVGIAIRWPSDSPSANNGNRQVVDCYSGDTLLTIGTTQNGVIRGNTVGVPDSKASIVFSGQALKMVVNGNRFAHGTNLMTILGQDHSFTGNIISSEVAFDAACTAVHWASDNVHSGFNGSVPWSTNSIETDTQISYTPNWTSSGTAPAYGNADVRGSYSVRGRMVRGQVAIIFGSTTTFGTGQYSFSLPLVPATLTKKFVGAAWVQGYPCVAWIDPANTRIQLYQPNGTIVTNAAPVALASGNSILFSFEFEMG